MKRVLYIEHNTDGTIGGSHLCLLDIVRNLDRSHYETIVCFFQDNPLIAEFEKAGALVISYPPWKPIRVPYSNRSRIAALLQSVLNFGRLLIWRSAGWALFLRRHKADLVHFNNACGYDHDAMLACWVSGIPLIVHERGIQKSISGMTRFFSRRASAIIAISDAVEANLVDGGVQATQIVRIDDGVSPKRLRINRTSSELRQQWNLGESNPIVGIVGNVKKWKGQEVIIQALLLLKPTYPSIKCIIVGALADPSYKYLLDETIRKYELDDAVIFTGFDSNPIDYVAIFDVFVHASIEPEPFGIVILEAMAMGKPVVASNAGGPAEIVIDGETGYLVSPGDSESLAERVGELLSDPAKRASYGEAGRKRFLDRYTDLANVRRIESLYASVLDIRRVVSDDA